MMTINWAEKRVLWLAAILLAAIAGYVDGYGLFFLKTYVSFMSGNTTSAGVASGQGNFHAAFLSGLAIVSFVTGSFLGNLVSQSRWRHCHRMMFCLITTGLALVTGLEWADLRNIPLEVLLLSVTMGMVNPVLSKVGIEAVSLTFVTGTLSRIGGHLALAAGQQPSNARQGTEDSHLARARIEASIWWVFGRCSFVRNCRLKVPYMGAIAPLYGHAFASPLQRACRAIDLQSSVGMELEEQR